MTAKASGKNIEKKTRVSSTVLYLKYPVFILLYALGSFLSVRGSDIPAFSVLLLLAFLESFLLFSDRIIRIDLRILMSLSWLTAVAFSCLKLSSLQGSWTKEAWISAGGFYLFFLLSFDITDGLMKKREKNKDKSGLLPKPADPARMKNAVFGAILTVSALGLVSFLTECICFDFELPIISDKPHAYTEFHITGIHYFIVSLWMVPAMSVYLLMEYGPLKGVKGAVFYILNGLSFIVPLLILSKYQLLMTVIIPFLIFVMKNRRISVKKMLLFLIPSGLAFLYLFCFIVMERKYPEGYLQDIFGFLRPETPLFIQYPFIYIVNNLENFNLLTQKLTAFSFGRRQCFPFLALTGLKFLPSFQPMFSYEVYVTKTELTTYSVIYDAYGDFGVPGVFLLGIVFGLICAAVSFRLKKKESVTAYLLYGQMAIYCTLSFFTTWLSNPTTLFYFLATAGIWLYIRIFGERGGFRWKKSKSDI